MQSRSMACTYCRQMKLACDAKALSPAPCTRCSKNHLMCTVDPTFRRTAKRRKLQELEQELEKIKATEKRSDIAQSPTLLPTISQSTPSNPSPSMAVSDTRRNPIQSRQIGDICVPARTLDEILQHFYTTYHSSFPVAADHDDFLNAWDQNDFLLWTIIAIASKSTITHSHYHLLLQPHVHQMAGDIYTFNNDPLPNVQALLLLCWWPFLYAASKDDPSWTYCALAGHVALKHGFHRPEHYSDFVYDGSPDALRSKLYHRAWAGCAIANQALSSHIGIPTTIRPRPMPLARLPPVLDQLLRISCQSYQICQSFGDCDDTSTGILPNVLTVLPAVEARMNALEGELRDASDPVVDMALLRTKLQLYSFAFTANGLTTPTNVEIAVMLAKASTSAVGLIHLAATRVLNKPWPAFAKLSVFYAANFLLFLSTLPGYDNQSVVRNAINEAWRILQSHSEFEHDSNSRWCQIIGYLSQVYAEKGRIHPPTLTVRSRMAANVVWENVWRARARFSERLRDSKPSDYTSAAALEDAVSLSLDDLAFDPSFLHGFDANEASIWFAEL